MVVKHHGAVFGGAELGLEFVPKLRFETGRFFNRVESLKMQFAPYGSLFMGSHQRHRVIFFSSENHRFRFDSSHLGRFQIGHHHNSSIRHALNRNMVHESRANLKRFGSIDIYLGNK